MKKLTFFLILIFLIFCNQVYSQLSGTYTVPGSYSTLTANSGIFAAINSQGLSGNVIIQITGNISESGTNSLNISGSNYTVRIVPSSASEKLISGSYGSGALFRFSGADKVTIDGRFSGSGKYLRFRNTNTSYPLFQFLNDSRANTITYCILESGNTMSTTPSRIGVINFGTTTGNNGNDSNTISYCDIRNRTDNGGTPDYAIYSSGTSTTTARYNSTNFILNNNIYNFYKKDDFYGGIQLTTGTGDGWIISGNSLYQENSLTSTVAAASGVNVIFLNSTSVTNCTISNNYIGGSAPNCGGTSWDVTTTNSNYFYGIRTYCGTSTASSVQGNTIANIEMSTGATTTGALAFSGIFAQLGLTNIGNVTGNTIGNTATTGSIKINFSGTGNFTQYATIIDQRGTGTISNNNISSFDISGTIPGQVVLLGISYQGTPGSAISITNNIVGSTTTANSIRVTSAGLFSRVYSIISQITNGSIAITGNTVANINNGSTDIAASLQGIYQARGAGSGVDISNNIIYNLTCASTSDNFDPYNCALSGIITASTNTAQTVNNNTIYALRTTANANTNIVGIAGTDRAGVGTMAKNRIYDLTNSSTSGAGAIYAIDAYWGDWTLTNNQITITNGEPTDNIDIEQLQADKRNYNPPPVVEHMPEQLNVPPVTNSLIVINEDNIESKEIVKPVSKNSEKDFSTNGVTIQGVHDEAEIGCTLYYNSIYIGGTAASGNRNSYCYARPLTDWPSPVVFRNNIFFNARTGGTGNHYAVGNEVTPRAYNWPAGSTNYNLLISPNASSVCEWGLDTNVTIETFRTMASCDANSWSGTTAQVSPANFFTSIASGNLGINFANNVSWYVNGKGVQIASINNDFAGNSRSTTVAGGATDIGSVEITPTVTPIVATQTGSIGYNQTVTFEFAKRTLGSITWGAVGTLPSSVTVSYYSGTNPPNSIPGALYSNAYWSITAVGGTGYTYRINMNYDVAIQGTISAESNIRLAKSSDNGTTWAAHLTAGTGAGQYQLNTATKIVSVYGLTSFSIFTLTDNTQPLPVDLSSFSASIAGRDVNLAWATTQEINNKGFEVERKYLTKNGYSDWAPIGFVRGNGTTNDPQYYKFTDSKLDAGKYMYRLKQIDYNGNYEYYSLNNPSELNIASPNIFDISQNYPNPSNPVSKIDYQIPSTGKVSIKVYNINGQEVASLVDEVKEAGFYTAEFNGSNLSSGVYFYRIINMIDGQQYNKTMKMILVK
jgi:hypothetical protein